MQARRGTAFEDDTLLSSRQVRERCGGVTRMCITRWRRDPRVNFPAPLKINGRNYWRLADLRNWQADRMAKTAGTVTVDEVREQEDLNPRAKATGEP